MKKTGYILGAVTASTVIAGLITMAVFMRPAAADASAWIHACKYLGSHTSDFSTTDDVYACGYFGDESWPDDQGGRVYIVNDQESWANGDPLNDVSGGYEIVPWDVIGSFFIKAWPKDLTPGKYNLILDLDVTGYNGVWTKNFLDPYGRYITDPIWFFEVVERELPDLTLSANDITFSNPIPEVGETITISATVHNIGNADAYDVVVQFFDGDPDTGGIQIGNDETIDSVGAGETGNAQIDWIATEATPGIYVLVDPYDDIAELKEDNNRAYNPSFDYDGDGDVDGSDLAAFCTRWDGSFEMLQDFVAVFGSN